MRGGEATSDYHKRGVCFAKRGAIRILREKKLSKSSEGGQSNRQGKPMIANDSQTVSHLRTALQKQFTTAHLAKPLGSNAGQGAAPSSNTPAPTQAPSQGTQGTDKK
jgi:hypothetical protein